ncbi:uncharacterized protein LOC114977278 [Acropora millepora]|uniref:uncharacterized protein LOC114977278 n=1 Tax=Acropora millepora TaxID=45264 RepID=UPI001CF39AE0|nr:uncharacterized protein LOC114977278 [Acropora millepora]
MAADNFFIPNAEEFFASTLSIFSQCAACLDYPPPPGTESRPYQGALRCDIEQLLNALRRILERLESVCCDNNEENDYEDITTGSSDGISSPAYSGLVGRPSFTISVEQTQALREGVFFRWTDIARILGVSKRTLSRRRQELGLSVGHGSNFGQISDAALDNLVRQILTSAPQSGIGLIRGALQSRGWRIQRHRIMAALQRLDPVMSALRQTRRIVRRT